MRPLGKIAPIGDDLPAYAVISGAVRPFPARQPSLDRDELPLVEIPGHKLRALPPVYDVDKVRLALLPLCSIVPLAGERDRAYAIFDGVYLSSGSRVSLPMIVIRLSI